LNFREHILVSFYESLKLQSSQRLCHYVIKYLPNDCFEVGVDTAPSHFVTCDEDYFGVAQVCLMSIVHLPKVDCGFQTRHDGHVIVKHN
jgi:hypothetical protein